MIIIGKMVLKFLITPFAQLGYELEMVQKLLMSRDKHNFLPDTDLMLDSQDTDRVETELSSLVINVMPMQNKEQLKMTKEPV